jgi:dienelactone hydrolase
MLTRREALALPLAALAAGYRLPAALADDDPTKVFTGGKKPTDVRLGPPKTLNGYFPFAVPKTKEAWLARRQQVREQLLVANGLWPMPEKTPLNPVVHGAVEKDGYVIEKVYFASTPGHYVTGNLYRPTGMNQARRLPGVLFAHGHWANGRFHDAGEKAAEASVKAKGEPDLDRGRFFMQAIPVTLARRGFVVFQYDMVGYADSTAIPHREGFTDAAAELRLQSQMGLQTWNSVRALDFLASLGDVDPAKLGMTGASGGGTQTFILAAIDDRLAAAFPAVMVSTGMQGGCVCENCSYLRVNTGNVEIAAAFAPKPMALSAANDWTKELMTKGYPELKELYTLLGSPDNVSAKAWLEYGHQYNVHAREFMYSWFAKHLQGKDEAVKEAPYKPTPPAELSVFDTAHPRPKDELNAARLREAMAKASDEQMAKLFPKDAATLAEFRRVVGTALRVMVGSSYPGGVNDSGWSDPPKPRGSHQGMRYFLARYGSRDHYYRYSDQPRLADGGGKPSPLQFWSGDVLPIHVAYPAKPVGQMVIWVHPKGKSSVYEKGDWHPTAKKLLDNGIGIVALDVLGVGEHTGDKAFTVDAKYAGYTYGYNTPRLAGQVHDVITAIPYIRRTYVGTTIVMGDEKEAGKPPHLVGWGEMGPVAVLAKALAGDKVAKLAADMNHFRFDTIKDAADPMMLPGAVKYGGLPAFLALCAPGAVLAHNHAGTSSGKLSKAAYDAAGAADKLTRVNEKLDDLKVVEWLIK